MRILITGANHPLGQTLTRRWQSLHHLRLTDNDPQAQLNLAGVDYQQADLRTPDGLLSLVDRVDAIVHLAVINPPVFPAGTAEQDLLDFATRGTYVLLDEARKAGVERLVLISTLAHFGAYPDEYLIDESWQPEPAPEATALAPYLSEITGREFAREVGIRVICLRLDEAGLSSGASSQETLKAIDGALHYSFSERGYRWRLYHMSLQARFKTDAVEKELLSNTDGGV